MRFEKIKTDRILLTERTAVTPGEITSLAKSLSCLGTLVPLIVAPVHNTDRFYLISGIKRYYAMRLADFAIAPCYVIDTPVCLAKLAISRNKEPDFFRIADLVRECVVALHMSVEELSEATGFSQKELVELLRIIKLGDFEREMIRKNSLSREIVYEVAFFDDITVRTALFAEIINSRKKLAEVKALCEREKRGKRRLFKAEKSPKFKDVRLFDNTLNRAVTMLREAGVNATFDTTRSGGTVEYKISLEN